MSRSPWIPISLGLVSVVLCLCVALALPETMGARTQGRKPSDLNDSDDQTDVDDDEGIHWFRKARLSFSQFSKAALDYVWGNKHVALLLSTYLLSTLGRFAAEILLQYVTKRYGWSWARVCTLERSGITRFTNRVE